MFIQYQTEEELENAMGAYLGPLVDFAKEVLKDKKDEWHTYPIYLKATGGLRTLSHKDRVRLMDCVIKLFNDKIYNPFDFNDERARVISGEEEAIYGWVGVNFGKCYRLNTKLTFMVFGIRIFAILSIKLVS